VIVVRIKDRGTRVRFPLSYVPYHGSCMRPKERSISHLLRGKHIFYKVDSHNDHNSLSESIKE